MNKIGQTISKFFHKKGFKYGTISIIMIAVVVAIAVFINLLVGSLPSMFNASFKMDLTPNKLYSLSDTSKEILKSLDKDVVIYGLFDDAKIGGDTDYVELVDLLDQYNNYQRIQVKYVDPDKNPGFLKEFDSENIEDIRMGDFIVVSGNKMRKLTRGDLIQTQFNQQYFAMEKIGSSAEQEFTGAIKYVSSDKTPVLYFTQGHQEEDIEEGYEFLKDFVKKNNYDIKSVNLFTDEKVPEDADILMVLSPKKDLSEEEKEKIRDYLDEGGKAIFMFDSLESDPEFNQFEDLLSDYNVSINYDKVKEKDGQRHVPDNEYDILPVMQNSDIISEPFEMIMPKSRSLNILKNKKTHLNVTSLLKTSDKAVGEQIDKSRGEDLEGPLDLAIAVSYVNDAKPTKILVMGNAGFITDDAVAQYGPYSQNGMYFFLMSLNWMQDKSNQVAIAPKMYSTNMITINAVQAKLIGGLVVIILPLIILSAGLLVYLRRRHL